MTHPDKTQFFSVLLHLVYTSTTDKSGENNRNKDTYEDVKKFTQKYDLFEK